MANYRPMPETSLIHFVAYPADTLYILTENRDTIVSQLLSFGHRYTADELAVQARKLDSRVKNGVRIR